MIVSAQELAAQPAFDVVRSFGGHDPHGASPPSRDAHAYEITALAVSPDHQLLASGSTAVREGIKLWDLRTGAALRSLASEGRAAMRSLAFSPDGATLLAGDSERVTAWTLASGESRVLSHATGVHAVGFTADGSAAVAVWKPTAIHVWSWPEAGVVRAPDPFAGAHAPLALSRDASVIAAAQFENRAPARQQIVLYHARNGKKREAFGSAIGQIEAVAFSPDARALATIDIAGRAIVWDVAAGAELASLALETSGPFSGRGGCVAFGQDGALLVAIGRWLVSSRWADSRITGAEKLAHDVRRAVAVSDGSFVVGSKQGGLFHLAGARRDLGPRDQA